MKIELSKINKKEEKKNIKWTEHQYCGTTSRGVMCVYLKYPKRRQGRHKKVFEDTYESFEDLMKMWSTKLQKGQWNLSTINMKKTTLMPTIIQLLKSMIKRPS